MIHLLPGCLPYRSQSSRSRWRSRSLALSSPFHWPKPQHLGNVEGRMGWEIDPGLISMQTHHLASSPSLPLPPPRPLLLLLSHQSETDLESVVDNCPNASYILNPSYYLYHVFLSHALFLLNPLLNTYQQPFLTSSISHSSFSISLVLCRSFLLMSVFKQIFRSYYAVRR